jgi:mono/diheme cytochrome c family protein
MKGRKTWALTVAGLAVACGVGVGCWAYPSAHTISRNYGYSEGPVDPPPHGAGCQFDDVTHGGQLFKLYCGACHNARALAERPFANYEVAIAHMREQAYLTGKEYRQIIHFLRRWDDVGPPTPDVEPSPRRLVFSQPISELRPAKDKDAKKPDAPPAKQAGAVEDAP